MTREELQKKLIDAPDSEKINELFDDFQKNVKLDSEVDSWLSKNYQSLKELSPDIGKEAFKAKPSVVNSEADLVKMFGLEGDEGAKQLFSTGEKSWARVPQWRKEQIAKDNGMEWPELKAKLVDADKAYNEKQRQEYVSSIFKNDFNPKFTEHPLEWVGVKLANGLIPDIVENVKEDVLNGKGGTSYASFFEDQVKNHTADVAADVALGALSFVPVGKIVSTAKGLGGAGRVIIEGLHQGANTAASEGYGSLAHDKDFGWGSVTLNAGLGSGLEVDGKMVADFLKEFGSGSKKVSAIAGKIEEAFKNSKEEAEEYIHSQKEKIRQYEDPVNNPGSEEYVMSKENLKNKKITEEDYLSAKQAEDIFKNIENGTKPKTTDYEIELLKGEDGIFKAPEINEYTRDMSDNELFDILSNHEPLLDYMKSKDVKKPLTSRTVKEIVEHIPEISKVVKSNPSSREDVEKQDKIRKKKKDLYDQFENGDIPRSPQDPTWKDYMEWARKYPEKNDKAKLLSLM